MPVPMEHGDPHRPLPESEAAELASSMGIFATGSRLQILYALLSGERSVEELAEETALPANTVSQQLRVLRGAHLVRKRRDGRRALYSLYDPHLGDLLAAIRHHVEHVAGHWAYVPDAPVPATGAR